MKLVLLGDGESPHLLKWARALAPHVELWAASSRGFAPGFDALVDPGRRLELQTSPRFEGGNVALLRSLPRLAAWLRPIRADWIHAHYLTSHGTMAWLARHLGVRARIAGSAWGSDILVTPNVSTSKRWITRRVLRACELCTSDSRFMAERMHELGASEVMVFPFGLETMPPQFDSKEEGLFFANRGLETIYDPQRVLDVFAQLASDWPDARLLVANEGSLKSTLEAQVAAMNLVGKVQFVGRLDAASQAALYARARWYFSLPRSDSVSVSVLEAMAHGCIPIVSDLPANRELVEDRGNGLILAAGGKLSSADLLAMQLRAGEIETQNRAWIAQHALFPDAVSRFMTRLQQLGSVA